MRRGDSLLPYAIQDGTLLTVVVAWHVTTVGG